MSAFEQHMKELADGLGPAAKELTKYVLEAEHRRRFSDDRAGLPEEFAHQALQALQALKPNGE